MHFWCKSCPRCRIDHLTYQPAVQKTITVPRLPSISKQNTSIMHILINLCYPNRIVMIKSPLRLISTYKSMVFLAIICTVRLYWAGSTWVNEMNFVMNHAPGARSISRPVGQQFSTLSLNFYLHIWEADGSIHLVGILHYLGVILEVVWIPWDAEPSHLDLGVTEASVRHPSVTKSVQYIRYI